MKHLLTLSIFCVVVFQTQVGRAQFRELVARIPSGSNAVILLNMEKIFNGPLGVQQGWAENHEKAFAAGISRVPPKAARFVLAAQVDLEYMEPIWEAGILDSNEVISLPRIAQERSGTLDSVENHQAIALPNDTYAVQFGLKTLGVVSPGNRQSVMRWVRDVDSRSEASLSPYLRQAAVYSDDAGTEIIIAVDLEGAFRAEALLEYLKVTSVLEGSSVDRTMLSKLLAGIQGIRIGIRVGQKPFGALAIDFHDDVSVTEPFAKPMLLEVLAGGGAQIRDLADWTPTVNGTVISMEGYLSLDGLRRVMTLVDSPAPSSNTTESPSDNSPSVSQNPEELKLQASLDHFHAVTSMFKDLSYDWKNLSSLSAGSLYFDKYAKRIQRLPILNVDADLLNYSAYVADQMQAASGSVRTMGIRGGVRKAEIQHADTSPYRVGYRYGGRANRWGGSWGGAAVAVYDPAAEVKSIDAQRRVVGAQERATMATDVFSIRDQVTQATNDIRRTMTQRYQVEF